MREANPCFTPARCETGSVTSLLLNLFEIASVNRAVLETARNLNFKDFEDAVIYSSAMHSGCNAVVTRNAKDFISADIPVFTPDELAKSLMAK